MIIAYIIISSIKVRNLPSATVYLFIIEKFGMWWQQPLIFLSTSGSMMKIFRHNNNLTKEDEDPIRKGESIHLSLITYFLVIFQSTDYWYVIWIPLIFS